MTALFEASVRIYYNVGTLGAASPIVVKAYLITMKFFCIVYDALVFKFYYCNLYDSTFVNYSNQAL